MRTHMLVITLLLTSSVSFAQQTNCTKHIGGEITCTGPGGYTLQGREHINGQTSYYDNRGNVGTVTQTTNGGVNVSPSVVGRSAPPPAVESYAISPNGVPNVGSRMIPRRPNPMYD